jgi:glycerol-3-phosphate O-acyltransferase
MALGRGCLAQESTRRDPFFLPVAITFERLVEEISTVEELHGDTKEKERLRGQIVTLAAKSRRKRSTERRSEAAFPGLRVT